MIFFFFNNETKVEHWAKQPRSPSAGELRSTILSTLGPTGNKSSVLNLCEGVNKKHFHNKKTRLRRATETAFLSMERQTGAERQKRLIKARN